jgi:hypothetical protein
VHFQLKGDAQTRAEAKDGNPTYMVMKEYAPGLFLPVPDPDNAGLPQRVSFLEAGAPPKTVQAAAQDVNLWQFSARSALRLLNEAELYAVYPEQTTPEEQQVGALVRKAYDAVQAQRPKNAQPLKESPNQFPALTPEEEKKLLDKLGYPNIEAFAKDLNKFDMPALLHKVK